MKYFTTTAFTLLFAIFAVTVFANSNAKVYEGSVILENGQTLEGKIEMLSPTLNEVKVKFIDNNGRSTTYKAKEVAGYNFIFPKYNAKTKSYDNQVIEYVKREVSTAPIPFGPREVLVERQVKGSISLYNFYVETRASSVAFTHNYFVEKDGQMIALDKSNYKEILKDLVADYPELKTKIGRKGYNYSSIAELIEEYNDYTSPKGVFYGAR
ncbi:MAG: hypothetical protein HC803_00165 [Saprospiraceae bacterium]|nr:hypothetical protein [Saprospiraceae bacterium]